MPWWQAASSLVAVVMLAAWVGTLAAAAAVLGLVALMGWAAWRRAGMAGPKVPVAAEREATDAAVGTLSGLENVEGHLTPEVYPAPARSLRAPIASTMGLRVRQKLSSLRPGFASMPQARQSLGPARPDAVVLYRPLRSLPKLGLRGVEAALRWRHPAMGSHAPEVLPDAWPEAMDADMASALLDVWLSSALPQFDRWWPRLRAQGCSGLWLRVPVAWSALGDFGPRLIGGLNRQGLDPSVLVLRVPLQVEGGRPRLPPSVLSLQAQGVTLAVDAFGEGGTSLAHLEHLPVRTVCLAASFIERAGPATPQRWVVESTAKLATSMGMSTLAEAVNDPGQVLALATLGCRFGVGDACGPWMDAAEWETRRSAGGAPHQQTSR